MGFIVSGALHLQESFTPDHESNELFRKTFYDQKFDLFHIFKNYLLTLTLSHVRSYFGGTQSYGSRLADPNYLPQHC